MTTAANSTNLLEHIWDLRDPRVDDWPLMNSPLPTIAFCGLYFYIVKWLGPRIMRDRKAFDLRNTIIVYNFIQVIFSAWLVYEIFYSGWSKEYSFWCEPLDTTNSPLALSMAAAAWWYYISKFTEFFDTFFFILRKKTDNVSTLHVMHHGIMPLFAWEACRFVPGGHESFGALFNTIVHVVMYSYYFLAAFGPRFQKYLWWKRHLTKLQLIQFATVLGHSFLLIFSNKCGYPIIQSAISSAHMIMFFGLFMQFYARTYNKKKAVKKED